jgi:ubiquinone/menaquinone biosynthesis C-methylase UbiE
MHERRFNQEIERLRDAERVARLEVGRVVDLALENKAQIHTVLDMGTGSGLFAEQFAARKLLVTGLDANPEMLSAARQIAPQVRFEQGVAEKMPFLDGSFELVFMGLLLHETDDPLAALREARRVAVQRIAILEWPDEDQPFGPPREHRLSFDKINLFVNQVGIKKVDVLRLDNLVLYRIDR